MAARTTKAKRTVIVTDVPNRTLTFHQPVKVVKNGREAWGPGDVIRAVRVDDYPDEMKTLAMMTVGFRNKFMDAYADPNVAVSDALTQVHDQLIAGQWAVRGESSERTTMFIEAYANVKKQDVTYARRRVNEIEAGDDDEAKARLAAIRAHPQILAEMARIKRERAAEQQKAANAAVKTAGELVDL